MSEEQNSRKAWLAHPVPFPEWLPGQRRASQRRALTAHLHMKAWTEWAKRKSSLLASCDEAPENALDLDSGIRAGGATPPNKHHGKAVAFVSPEKEKRPLQDRQSALSSQHGGLCIPTIASQTPSFDSSAPPGPIAVRGPPSDPSATARLSSQQRRAYPANASLSVHRLSTSTIGHTDRSNSPYSCTSSTFPAASDPSALQWLSRSETTSSGKVVAPVTWAEMSDADLVANIGEREKMRQEVLWEIVASEERYLQELHALKETYLDPLLHPWSLRCERAPRIPSPAMSKVTTTEDSYSSDMSIEHLPIASRFATSLQRAPSATSSTREHCWEANADIPEISAEADPAGEVGRPIESKQSASEVPVRRARLSVRGGQLKKLLKTSSTLSIRRLSKSDDAELCSVHDLPANLLDVLELIGSELLTRHGQLSSRLRDRYAEQYPLVRTLVDIWSDQRWLVDAYSVYILHLECAIKDVDRLLKHASPLHRRDEGISSRERTLGLHLMALERAARARGEASLIVALSRPFQRLLKYPLLFASLLWHTDPTTADYNAARQLASDFDCVVRSIEDDKFEEDQRQRTRDAWARIQDITDETLAIPRSSRMLVQEMALWDKTAALPGATGEHRGAGILKASLKDKRSSRRLSDFLGGETLDREPPVGSKRDIWLVTFTDVIIRCQRVGSTRLPIVAMQTAGPSLLSADQPRNLYRFLSIESWKSDSIGAVQSLEQQIHERRRAQSYTPGAVHAQNSETDEPRMSYVMKRPSAEVILTVQRFSYSGDSAVPVDTDDQLTSDLLHSTVLRRESADAKFSGRGKASFGTEAEGPAKKTTRATPPRFAAPTAASRARATSPKALSPLPSALRRSRASTFSIPSDGPQSTSPAKGQRNISEAMLRSDSHASGFAAYQAFWATEN